MKSTSTKMATVGAAVGIVAVLLALSGALTPVFATTAQATTTTTTTTSPTPVSSGSIPSLTVGQTITFTSTAGHFRVVGDRTHNGTASGTVTVTVTGKFASGYSLSITSGTLNVNGTKITISSGSAETGADAHHMVGQGVASSGAFLVKATARGTFGGEYATMSLDLNSGATEYAIALIGNVQS